MAAKPYDVGSFHLSSTRCSWVEWGFRRHRWSVDRFLLLSNQGFNCSHAAMEVWNYCLGLRAGWTVSTFSG